MTEDFLQFLWQYRLFNEEELFSKEGKKVEIIHVGTKNSDAGPDFFNARIRYNGIEWAGNIEIHKNASDWNLHKHFEDENYDNIILHVVANYDTDVYNSKQQPILTIQLSVQSSIIEEYKSLYENHKPIACIDKINTIDYPISTYFESMAVSKLSKKSLLIQSELKDTQNNWEETFYRLLAYSFGLKANAQAFLMLAQATPLHVVKKNADNLFVLEALLFGQSGLLPERSTNNYVKELINEYRHLSVKYSLAPLPSTLWKFSKIHPPSFPTIRIAQWAYFLYQNSNQLMIAWEKMTLKKMMKLFSIKTSSFWEHHYTFEKYTSSPTRNKIGKSFAHLLIINAYLPFVFLYCKEHQLLEGQEWVISMYEQIPSEKNHIIKYWNEAGIVPQNALQSQALIYLYEHYCKPRFCLRCNIGTYLLLHTKKW